MLEEECVTSHTLPLSTLTLQEVKDYAIRPFRIRSALEKDRIAPFVHIRFQLNYENLGLSPGWDEGTAESQVMLPGGRWLLTLGFDDHHLCLCCWDLVLLRTSGPSGITRLTPVSMIEIPSPTGVRGRGENQPYQTLSVQSDPIEDRVNILVCFKTNEAYVSSSPHDHWPLT